MCTPCNSYYMASLFTPNSHDACFFVDWNWIHAFLYRSTRNWTMLTTRYHYFNKLICYTGQLYLWTRLYNSEPCNMLHIKCQVSTVLVVCTLASMPVRYPDWLETNAECRVTCEYGEAWLALQLVMERWMPSSVKHGITLWSTSLDTVRHVRHSLANYISLDIDDIVWVHSLWWYCIPASWHFNVHRICLYKKQSDN
jgi:hypothetical protein